MAGRKIRTTQNTRLPMRALHGLLGPLLDHMDAYPLPGPDTITLDPARHGRFSVGVPGNWLSQEVAAVVAWADTLHNVTADVWRMPDENTVLVTACGMLPASGHQVKVSVGGGMPYLPDVFGRIEPGEAVLVTLTDLRKIAASGVKL